MAMADNNEPVFQIQRVYMKEASLEQPNSPAILLEQEQPTVDIQLGVEAQQATDAMFEVAVSATVTTKIKDRTVFLVEVKQAGIFEIRNVPQEQMQAVMGIACPQIIYPYLRANVADIVTRGLPAGAPGRDQLPVDVRAAAGATAAGRLGHHHQRVTRCAPRPWTSWCSGPVPGARRWPSARAGGIASRCGRAMRRKPRHCAIGARTFPTSLASACRKGWTWPARTPAHPAHSLRAIAS
jgi:preprotein translocase subunit SecB